MQPGIGTGGVWHVTHADSLVFAKQPLVSLLIHVRDFLYEYGFGDLFEALEKATPAGEFVLVSFPLQEVGVVCPGSNQRAYNMLILALFLLAKAYQSEELLTILFPTAGTRRCSAVFENCCFKIVLPCIHVYVIMP